MTSIVVELKNEVITQIGVESIIDFYRTIAIDRLHFPGLNVFATGVDSSSLNVVLDSKESTELNAQTIDAITKFFANHHVPWGWFITTISKTSDIEKYGFNLLYETPGMYFDLSNKLPNIAVDVEISEARGDLKEWIKPLQDGFPSSDNGEAYRKLNAELLQKGEQKLRHFTAYSKKQAASSATLFLSDDSVMLHNLATKNKFRQRGMGSALIVYLMNEAKKAGYKHCFLDASAEGFNLYSKLGFKVYCVTSVCTLPFNNE